MPRHHPSTPEAMQALMAQIRTHLPVEQPDAYLCRAHCVGCPKKLMEYLETELLDWEAALERGETPTLGDINKLAKSSRKIHTVMVKNGLAEPL